MTAVIVDEKLKPEKLDSLGRVTFKNTNLYPEISGINSLPHFLKGWLSITFFINLNIYL